MISGIPGEGRFDVPGPSGLVLPGSGVSRAPTAVEAPTTTRR
ncbi:hypothetical protein [Streptacidiphilus sp. P02-A3a]|nr:hypothetical protein [Streptacidiphilus sp. P02-A3a]